MQVFIIGDVKTSLASLLFNEMPIPSEESKRLCICEFRGIQLLVANEQNLSIKLTKVLDCEKTI